jgi:hypothetical protein
MFDALFDVLSAWYALLYIIAGASLSGFGLLVAGYTFYVRATERAYTGQIVSMRTEGPGKNMYWPVVAYTDGQGQRHEALANSGSSLIGGNVPGRKVTVFAAPSAPDALMIARDLWILLALGLFLLAVGSPFIAVGFEMLHFNFRTALVALALAGYVGFKLFRLVHPFLDARKAGGWTAARDAFMARAAQRQAMQPVSAAEIAALGATQSKQFAAALPLLVIVGAALLIGGGFWYERQSAFLSTAIAADGVVLRNEASDDSDGKITYHAVVSFTDSTERRVTFHDGVGTSPPSFSTGDKVRVLYLRQDASRAEIDRGMWNWLVPLLIAGFGGLLLGGGAYGYASRRRDVAPSLSARDPAPSA